MNLPRLSDEELPTLPRLTYTDREVLTLMRTAAEAQRLKDEQCLREQKPVAHVRVESGRLGGARRGVGMEDLPDGDHDLFAAPVPASQGDGVPANVSECAQRMKANGYAGPLSWARTVIDWVAAAPVTTKESSHE